jgi:hypothetical protein
MKKTMILTNILITLFLVVSCGPSGEPPQNYDELLSWLERDVPIVINDDFELPKYPGTSIEWTFQNLVLDQKFDYRPPFIDYEAQLIATIKFQGETKVVPFFVQVIAPESGLNKNRIELTLPIQLSQLTKETYVSAEVVLRTTMNGVETIAYESINAEIRGRGNSSWGMPKKPFRLRLESATSLLGMPNARSYVFLAEYADKSLLRNTIVHKFSSMLEHLEHTITTRAIDVYINGAYQGVYVMTEQVEVRKSKLDIDTNPNFIDTGYFIELDRRFETDGGRAWFTVSGVPYEIKEPDAREDTFQQAHTTFIRNLMIQAEQALIRQDNYEDYVDIDNWIDYFIVQELFKNVDVGFSSVFMYRQPGGRLKFGPLWDFDLAIGNADYIDWGAENFYGMAQDKNPWFHLMMNIPEVRERFRLRYLQVYTQYVPEILETVLVLADGLEAMATRNFFIWNILGFWVWPNTPPMLEARTFREQVDFVYEYIDERSQWMYQAVHSTNYRNGVFR